jgi:hypothetical protein
VAFGLPALSAKSSAMHWLSGAYMQSFKSTLISAACVALLSLSSQAAIVKPELAAAAVEASAGMRLVPSGRGYAVQKQGPSTFANPGKNGIHYHGGAVMLGNVNVYYIWYGDKWTGDPSQAVLTDLIKSTGGSAHYNINTTYYQGVVSGKKVKKQQAVSNAVSLAGQAFVTSASADRWHGNSLDDTAVGTVVAEAIASGDLPSDTNGVYFVLTDIKVKETSGFCTSYCGWHSNAPMGGANIKFSFVGNPAKQCPNSCSMQAVGPNGKGGGDAMASVIMHELEEAVTDPDVSGNGGLNYGWWDDMTGMENADKCAWTFGTTYTTANGAMANMKLGERDFLIQQNWVNATGGFCAVSY